MYQEKVVAVSKIYYLIYLSNLILRQQVSKDKGSKFVHYRKFLSQENSRY